MSEQHKKSKACSKTCSHRKCAVPLTSLVAELQSLQTDHKPVPCVCSKDEDCCKDKPQKHTKL